MSSRLVEKIRAIEERHAQSRGRDAGAVQPPRRLLATGWPEVDAALGGGLPRGGLHEFLGLRDFGENAPRGGEPWRPPIGLLVHLAWRTLDADGAGRWTVWIGRRCFPYPAVLLRRAGRDRALLDRSLFVSPRTAADRLWAIDLAVRSPAVGAVIADGGEFDMAATRRIQLAAKNHGTPALLARPPWESAALSAAQTRWLVRRAAPSSGNAAAPDPAWDIELLRCKGVQRRLATDAWRLEWDRAACTLHLSSPVGDSAGAAPAAAAGA